MPTDNFDTDEMRGCYSVDIVLHYLGVDDWISKLGEPGVGVGSEFLCPGELPIRCTVCHQSNDWFPSD
jgi:hypothetical protein